MARDVMPLIGPAQVIAVVLHEPKFDGRILDELTALEDAGVVTLIDAAIVVRESEDAFSSVDIDVELFEGRPLLGALVGSLIGFGAAGEAGAAVGMEAGATVGLDPITSSDLHVLAEELPVGGAAAIVVLEQTWARGLMGAIRDSAGVIISDEVLHAEDFIELGIELGLLADLADDA